MDYKFHNANPLGKIESDCVCRAISKATNIDYYKIEQKLKMVASLFECDKLCVYCYHHLLEKVFGLRPRFPINKTVGEVAKENKDKTLIIRVHGHLTMSENGIVYDIWDCTKEIVDMYWIVE